MQSLGRPCWLQSRYLQELIKEPFFPFYSPSFCLIRDADTALFLFHRYEGPTAEGLIPTKLPTVFEAVGTTVGTTDKCASGSANRSADCCLQITFFIAELAGYLSGA